MQKKLTVADLKATEAAALLKLPKNDSAVFFYQGLELYEDQQYQASLLYFILAFQGRVLHAWPYLKRLTDPLKPLVVLNDTQKGLLADFKSYDGILSYFEIRVSDYFEVSQTIIAQRVALAKESSQQSQAPKVSSRKKSAKTKTKAQKEQEKYFKSKNQFCAHFFYHRSKFSKESALADRYEAASQGHLLAIAESWNIRADSVPARTSIIYGQLLSSSDFHDQYRDSPFSVRIFCGVISQAASLGKKELHFESCRLGVIEAFPMVVKLYFDEDKKKDQALALCYWGVRYQEPHSRFLLISTLPKASMHLKQLMPGFDHETIVTMLLDNLKGNYAKLPIVLKDRFDAVIREMLSQTVAHLQEYLHLHREDDSLLGLPKLVEWLEEVSKHYEDNLKILYVFYQELHLISSRQRRLVNDFEGKLRLNHKTLHYLERCLAIEFSADIVNDMRLIAEDVAVLLNEISADHRARYIEELHKIKSVVDGLEAFILAEGNSHGFSEGVQSEFIEFTFKVYEYFYWEYAEKSDKPDNFEAIEKRFNQYRDLGIKFNVRRCYQSKLKYCMSTLKDYKQARDLYDSYKGEHDLESSQISAAAYFFDPAADSEQGFLILEKYADQIPALYNVMGDFCNYGSIGVRQNRERARRYYVQGEKAGCLDAALGVTLLVIEDYGSASEEQKPELRMFVVNSLERLVNASNCDGFLFRGKRYLYGDFGYVKDLELAAADFSRAADLGNVEAGALLAMIEAGYAGTTQTVSQLVARYQYLDRIGALEYSTHDICNYGILCLAVSDPQIALSYLLRAVQFNNPTAQVLIASFHILLQIGLLEFTDDIMKQLMQTDSVAVAEALSNPHVSEAIKHVYQFSMAMKKGVEDGREIGFDYFMGLMTDVVLNGSSDIQVVIDQMYKKFPDTERKKILKLADKMDSERSGDRVCADYTEHLLSGAKNDTQKLSKRLQAFKDGGLKLTEHNISQCLVNFFKKAPKLQGEEKKAVTAVVKMHPHHGDGSHRGGDEIDGGRQKTVMVGLEAMLKVTDKLMRDSEATEVSKAESKEESNEGDLNSGINHVKHH